MTRSLSRNLKRIVAGLCAVLIVSGTVPVQPIAEHINEYTAITASAVTTIYTKDSEGIADGVILKPGESINTAGTSEKLVFDSDTKVDFDDTGDVFVKDSGGEWVHVNGFKLNENGKFYCTNYGDDSLLIPDDGKTFKVSYDSANDRWHIAQVDSAVSDADPVSYLKWDDTEKKLVEQTGDAACKEYTVVTAETTAFEDGKWYVVNADTTISSRITVTGTAHLILADGKTLTASKGIQVAEGNTLNIYAQSDGDNAGKLFAYANDYNSSIGGGDRIDSGTVTVNGGNITANGGYSAAGIGGGRVGAGGTVTVNGGTVTANGGGFAAGIGGGAGESCGTVTINGGNVTANGGKQGAGIGSGNGYGVEVMPSGGTVTIYNGTVTATGGEYAAGIGGGSDTQGGTVIIYDGTVNAYGNFGGSGIGGGSDANGGDVTIHGGTVTAYGGGGYGSGAMGIGKGANFQNNGTLTVADTHGVFGGESADPTDIQTDYASTRWMYMIVKGVPHSHDFGYSADGATVTATCNGKGMGDCDITEGLTMTISASDATYDGTAHGATLSTGYNTTAFPGTYTIEYFKGETKLDGAPVDAGNYTAKVTVGGATASVDFTIAKKSVTVTAEAKSKTYGKDDPELTYTAEGLVGSDTLSGALTRAAGENVGTYDITQGTLTAGDNYDINFSGAKFKINKAEITITADDKSTQYKSDIAPLTYQVSGDYVEGDELNIELSTTATNTSPIGEYDIVASYSNDNYDATLVKGKYTITKADLTTSATGYSGKYDGEAHSISVDVGDSDAVVYYGTEELTTENYKTAGSTTNPAYTDAGEYTVYYYIATGNYDPQPVSGSKVVKIDKADPTVTQPTAKELTANGEAQELVNAGSTEDGKIVYALGTDKDTAPAEDAYSETVPTGKDAGTYYVWYKVLSDGNHNDTEPASVEVKIAEPETQPENKQDGDTPAKTGAAAAGFGAVTLAAAAVIVSKKRKK